MRAPPPDLIDGRSLNRRVDAEFWNVLSVSKKDEILRFDERNLTVRLLWLAKLWLGVRGGH
jgi:hypothetical protein